MVEQTGNRPDFREIGNPAKITVLVDQDSVIADFEGEFLRRWQKKHPELPYVPYNQRSTFALVENYPEDLQEQVRAVHSSRGFIASLPPIKGAIDSLNQMKDAGFIVRICTSPLTGNRYSLLEKYDWVNKHLGKEWIRRLIITSDKTLVRGDILIDDKPEITGDEQPAWEHVIFDAPYNRYITGKRRMSGWGEWKGILIPN